MVAAGLLAKKAVERGLDRAAVGEDRASRPARRSSPSTSSARACTPYLEALGFHTVGYGCTTCIGNSGPLPGAGLAGDRRGRPRRLRRPLRQPQLRGAHPSRGEGELPRVAAARRRLRARRADGRRPRRREPLGHDAERRRRLPARRLADAGGDRETIAGAVGREMFERTYADVFTGDRTWRELPVPEGDLFAWDDASTYVRQPPYFDGHGRASRAGRRHPRRALPRLARRLGHDRPHLARPARSSRTRPPGATSSSTASSARTSTRTARAAATTR